MDLYTGSFVAYITAMKTLVWITLLISGTQLISGDLSGRIQNSESLPISGAKIIIFNEVSVALAQRVYTDRNGTFKVTLPPGSYLVWVTRQGFSPFFERIMLPSGDADYHVSWLLHSKEQGDEDPTNSLKYILRHAGRGTHRQQDEK